MDFSVAVEDRGRRGDFVPVQVALVGQHRRDTGVETPPADRGVPHPYAGDVGDRVQCARGEDARVKEIADARHLGLRRYGRAPRTSVTA